MYLGCIGVFGALNKEVLASPIVRRDRSEVRREVASGKLRNLGFAWFVDFWI